MSPHAGPTRRLPFDVIFDERYDLNLGGHVFPSAKFRLIRDALISRGIATPADIVAPEPATDDDLELVHTADWVRRLKHLQLTFGEINRLEIPLSPELVRALWLAAGGSILAARRALADGVAYNVGGGFHHAFPGHGEGFCAIHDVAVAIRRLQKDGAIQRAMVVDVDVHHGNGTAGIFANDPSVFTLSIHQFNNYPFEKPPSDIDIHLPDGVGDADYLKRLGDALRPALDSFRPDLLYYIAGGDPYEHDRLGGLRLTLNGLLDRDRLVLREARNRRIPVAIALAGGYAEDVEDTVTIHVNTLLAALETERTSAAPPTRSPAE
ncbi:MAG: histone deacetylase superfamily protein [bacterium]|nr:MAG: histone deacetylase superfamily protein [bacterium]